MEQINGIIEELIASKDFDELTSKERELVLKEFSESEYKLRRRVVLEAESLLEDESHFVMPDPQIKANLKAALNAKQKNWSFENILESIIGTRIPAYQVVLGVLLLAFGFMWFDGDKSKVQVITKERIVYQPQIDTIVVKEEIPVEKIKIIEKIVEVPVKKVKEDRFMTDEGVGFSSSKTNPENNSFAYTDEEIEEQQLKSMGNTSLGKDELDQFLVVVN